MANFDHLLPVLENVKNSKHEGPFLVHAVTKKAKVISQQRTQKISITVYQNLMLRQEIVKIKINIPSYTSVFGETLTKHAEKDSKIVTVTAAMPSGTGVNIFKNKFPKDLLM